MPRTIADAATLFNRLPYHRSVLAAPRALMRPDSSDLRILVDHALGLLLPRHTHFSTNGD